LQAKASDLSPIPLLLVAAMDAPKGRRNLQKYQSKISFQELNQFLLAIDRNGWSS
jgi:hypothetical protein